jgi:hypothetical protein
MDSEDCPKTMTPSSTESSTLRKRYLSSKHNVTTKLGSFGDHLSAQVGKTTAASQRALQVIDANRNQIAETLDTTAKTTRVVATVAAASAAVAAPTGLTAIGVSLGIVSAPVIVTVAPVLAGIAVGAAAVSASASLYKKYRNRHQGDSDA